MFPPSSPTVELLPLPNVKKKRERKRVGRKVYWNTTKKEQMHELVTLIPLITSIAT
jgi:hypothetical protein